MSNTQESIQPPQVFSGGGFRWRNYAPGAFFFAAIAVFWVWKLNLFTLRFGDGNAYVYMAKAVWDGFVPYRDFFLADPPVFVLTLSLLRSIFRNNLYLYQALPLVLETGTAVFLFLLLRHWQNRWRHWVPLVYLFSFTVLATSDYLTGAQLAVFFAAVAWYLWIKDSPFLSGIFWVLSFLTKLYMGPMFAGLIIYELIFQKKYRAVLRLIAGSAVAAAGILLPFAILAPKEIFNYTFIHQLQRPPGLDRGHVWGYFFKREWLVLGLAALGAFFGKQKILILSFAGMLIFFALFIDIYYAYFDSFYFFAVLLALLFLERLRRDADLNFLFGILAVGYVLFLIFSANFYFREIYPAGQFTNSQEIAEYVRNLPEDLPLYGSHEGAPLIALQSGRPLFDNRIDTNMQAFGSGAQDLGKISRQAVERGVYFIARVTDLPELGINNQGFEGYFIREEFDKHCRLLRAFPSTAREQDNYISVFRCAEDWYNHE